MFGAKPLQPLAFQVQQPAAAATSAVAQQNVQQLILDVNALVKSVSGPELCNDDRDGVIAKLNQLMAAVGVGQGHYKDGVPPVNYDNKNMFYRFKGVCYNKLCRNSNEDGVVVLLLNVAAAQLTSPEQKQKLVEQIDNILGQKAVHTVIEGVKAADAQKTEVLIHVFEKGRGRVDAMILYKYLTQADKLRLLQQQIACQKVVPLLKMSDADREKFLNTPPAGFDPALWRQGVRANPDPDRLLPQPIYGFDEVVERQKVQKVSHTIQKAVLDETVTRLKRVSDDLSNFKSHLNGSRRIEKELSHRILRIAIHMVLEQREGYALSKTEDKILAQSEQSNSLILAPNALKDRVNNILKLIESDRLQISEHLNNIDMSLTVEEENKLKQQLQVVQSRLEQTNQNLRKDRRTLDVAERQQK